MTVADICHAACVLDKEIARISAVHVKRSLIEHAIPQALKSKCSLMVPLVPKKSDHFSEDYKSMFLAAG